MLRTLYIFICILLVSSVLTASDYEWQGRASMEQNRSGQAGVVFDNKMYVMGGFTTDDRFEVMSSVEIYIPDRDEWRSGRDMPHALYYHTAVATDKFIYIFGGLNERSQPVNFSFRFNPITNQYQRLSEMPHPLYASQSFLMDGNIYIYGGRTPRDEQGAISSGFEYNIADDSWNIEIPRMVSPRSNYSMVLLGTPYVIGGIHFNIVASIETLSRDGWRTVTRIPNPRGHAQAQVIDRSIIFAGGFTGIRGGSVNNVEIYNTANNEWSDFLEMEIPRHDFNFLRISDTLYAVGGAFSGRGNIRTLNVVEALVPIQDTTNAAEENYPDQIELYTGHPNPTNGRITFTLPVNTSNVLIVDGLGRAVLSEEIPRPIQGNWSWNSMPCTAGTYYLIVSSNHQENIIPFSVIK